MVGIFLLNLVDTFTPAAKTNAYFHKDIIMASNSQIAFAPLGNSVVIPAAAVAPTGVQALVDARFDGQGTGQYRIINSSTNTVFLGVGPTAAIATANAVAPIAGTPSAAIVLVPGAVEVLRFGRESFFSGLAAAASTVYIVQGQGI
jgi:hypothetical protein